MNAKREAVETVEIDDLPDGSSQPGATGDEMMMVTVEKGHVVEAATGQKVSRGISDDGKERFRQIMRRYGPGEQLRLPESEARRLKEQGWLVDPNRRIPVLNEVRATNEVPVGLQQNNQAVGPHPGPTVR